MVDPVISSNILTAEKRDIIPSPLTSALQVEKGGQSFTLLPLLFPSALSDSLTSPAQFADLVILFFSFLSSIPSPSLLSRRQISFSGFGGSEPCDQSSSLVFGIS